VPRRVGKEEKAYKKKKKTQKPPNGAPWRNKIRNYKGS
jgi:hypothetical protein